MRKDRLYLLTFLSITLIFLLISSVSIGYLVDAAADKVLETQLEFSEREAKQAGMLIGNQLSEGVSKERTIASVQKSIENSNLESGFISLFDWSGKIICHPEVTQLGQKISSGESLISSLSDKLTAKDFYQLLQRDKEKNTNSDASDSKSKSEVVYLYPVENSDWIVAAHANTQQVSQQIETLRSNFQNILLIMGFVFILTSVVTVRLIGSNYEKKLEVKNQELSNEVINLSKLNSAVNSYQQKVIDQSSNQEEEEENSAVDTESTTKKRILTYIRNELLTVSTKDIAYIYTENTITYVMCFDGKRSTTNASLDELYSNLDSAYFFRANRQFIIAVSAIDKIVRYGNNQLKILINPNSEVDIIISKNRAAEFKQWLNL